MKMILAVMAALMAAPSLANCVDVLSCDGGRCRTVQKCYFGYMGNPKPQQPGQYINRNPLFPVPSASGQLCGAVNVCNAYGQCSVQVVC